MAENTENTPDLTSGAGAPKTTPAPGSDANNKPKPAIENGAQAEPATPAPEAAAGNAPKPESNKKKGNELEQKEEEKKPPKKPVEEKETGNPWADMWIDLINRMAARQHEKDVKKYNEKNAKKENNTGGKKIAKEEDPPAPDDAQKKEATADNGQTPPGMSSPLNTETAEKLSTSDITALDSMDKSAGTDPSQASVIKADKDAEKDAEKRSGPTFGGGFAGG